MIDMYAIGYYWLKLWLELSVAHIFISWLVGICFYAVILKSRPILSLGNDSLTHTTKTYKKVCREGQAFLPRTQAVLLALNHLAISLSPPHSSILFSHPTFDVILSVHVSCPLQVVHVWPQILFVSWGAFRRESTCEWSGGSLLEGIGMD